MKDISKPWILGIASSHNGAVCLLHGDQIVVAIQEERLLRMKRAGHPGAKNSLALRYCLDYAGIDPEELSAVVLSASGFNDIKREDLTLNEMLRTTRNQVHTEVVPHHLAHAVGAFATSGFPDATVLVVDGSGSPWSNLDAQERAAVKPGQYERYAVPGRGQVVETISIYAADETSVRPIEKHVASEDRSMAKTGMKHFYSLGSMYYQVAAQIFSHGFDGSGKVMGLAPYGSPTVPVAEFLTIMDGEIHFNCQVSRRFPYEDKWPNRKQEYQNLAASVQAALEEALLFLVKRASEIGSSERLCYAGGVALNSVANERIVREGGFKEVFIMPAAEDSGTAIGAAYYGLWRLSKKTPSRKLLHDAVGRQYSRAEVEGAISNCASVKIVASENVLDEAAEQLAQGKIIGWFQGRSELGPRALGQRSILCDPRHSHMKHTLNSRVKFREEFRPFAPVIPLERVGEYFDAAHCLESPFMLRVMAFQEHAKQSLPAVSHVDGTGRVQTLTREANGGFYDLVDRFYRKTGSPVLLNTSFNIAGEPIVETPEDALSCFLFTGMDLCLLEHVMVAKVPEYTSALDLRLSLAAERISVDYKVTGGTVGSMQRELPYAQFLQTVHIDSLTDMVEDARFGGHALQVLVRKRWGWVMNIMNIGVYEVLKRIDGSRNGWQILQAISEELRVKLDVPAMEKTITALKRAAIINLHEPKLKSTQEMVYKAYSHV